MNQRDNFSLSLLVACTMKQHQFLEQMSDMLRELMDRVDSVGDSVWQMERARRSPASLADLPTSRKRTAKKRHPALKRSASRKRRNNNG